jgi:hypothetical protein
MKVDIEEMGPATLDRSECKHQHEGGTLLAIDPEIMTGWCPAVVR